MYTGPGQPRLLVGGTAGAKLMALNPATGQRDVGFLDLGIADSIVVNGVTAFGGVGVNNFAISPNGTKLVAVGNFSTSASRAERGSATLARYYQPFNDVCASTRARRLTYLSDVDFAAARHPRRTVRRLGQYALQRRAAYGIAFAPLDAP